MRMTARVQTEYGPRTVVAQGLSDEAASMLRRAVVEAGGSVHLSDDGHVVNLARYIRENGTR